MIGYGFYDTGSEVPVSICIFGRFVMPKLISSFGNRVLNEHKIHAGSIVLSKGDDANGV